MTVCLAQRRRDVQTYLFIKGRVDKGVGKIGIYAK
jgi:hypothetical protein